MGAGRVRSIWQVAEALGREQGERGTGVLSSVPSVKCLRVSALRLELDGLFRLSVHQSPTMMPGSSEWLDCTAVAEVVAKRATSSKTSFSIFFISGSFSPRALVSRRASLGVTYGRPTKIQNIDLLLSTVGV